MATFTGTAGNDVFTPGTGVELSADNLFQFDISDLSAADVVEGTSNPAFTDTLEFLTNGNIASAQFAGVTNIEILLLAAGDNTVAVSDAMSLQSNVPLTIIGNTGIDNVNATGATASVTLSGGDNADSLSGGSAADTLQGGSGKDQLFGSDGDDTLIGGSEADMLYGGAGGDVHDGGGSIDYARYNDANYGDITASLGNTALNTNIAVGDTYINIEGLIMGLGDDEAYGDSANNFLFGMQGDDMLYGGDGADRLHGGTGFDYARYDDAAYGDLIVSMTSPALNTGSAAGDTYIQIEGVIMGAGNDELTGDANDNFLHGLAGDDKIAGAGGVDNIFGGLGDDTIAADGSDIVDGGDDTDTVTPETAGVALDLTTVGQYTDVENFDLRGSAGSSLVTDTASVVSSTDANNSLVIFGDSGTPVDIGTGWVQDAGSFTKPDPLTGTPVEMVRFQLPDNSAEVFVQASGGVPVMPLTVGVVSPPELDANGAAAGVDYALSYVNGSADAVAVSADASVIDVDDNITSMTVVLTATAGALAGGEGVGLNAVGQSLALLSGLTVTGAGTDSMTISGTASPDVYQDLLRQVTYSNPDTSGAANTADRTIAFEVTDEATSVSAAASTTVTISVINTPPVLFPVTQISTDEDVAVNGSAPVAFDFEGDTASYAVISGPSDGTLTGGIVNPTTGEFEYTPDADFNGQDSFVVEVTDSRGASIQTTITVTVDPVNDNPVITGFVGTPAPAEDASTIFTLTATDADGDATTLEAAVARNGSVVIVGSTVTYTPDADFNGMDSITVIVSDGNGGTAVQSFDVTVAPENDLPTVAGVQVTASEDSPLNGQLPTPSDVDGDTVTYVVASGGTTAGGTFSVAADGTYTYTPAADYSGPDSFTFMVNDGTANSAAATVNIVVNPSNDAPTAVDDAATVAEDSTGNLITVLTNDSPDPDGDALTVSAAIARNGDVSVVANQLQYTPDADFSGTDTIHYVISDGNGGTSVATVTVTVTPGNDAPVVSGATVTTSEDSALSGTLPAPTDADGTSPTFVANSTTDGNGTFAVLADGTYTFTPAANVNGTFTYNFDVTDGMTPTTATLTIQVNAVNDGPVANDFTYAPGATEGGAAVAISVAADVSDVDGDVPNVAAAIAEHGTVTFLGQTINYTPDSDFSGTDTISYIVTDGNGGSAVATITVAVANANDDPTVAGLTTSGVEDQVLTGQLPAPVDPDGDAVTFTVVAGAATTAGGMVDVSATGAFTYTPAANYHGPDSFTFTVDDGNGGTATATVTLDIASVNDAPVAVDVATGTHTTPDNTEVTITIPAATDADSDPISLVTAIAANGSIFVSGDDIIYTPRPGFTGDDTITYLVSDGNGATDTATIIVSVTANNDAPVFPITTLSVATNEDNAVTSQVPAATDADGDALTYSVEAADVPANGSVAIDPTTGVFTYTPTADNNGADSFTVTVTDGGGLTDTVVISVNVAAENDVPSITGITGGTTVNEEASLVLTVATTDPEADTVSITSAAAQGGSVTISGNMITYTPDHELATGATATDTITVIVSDGNGGFDTSELTVTVTGVDDASVLGDDQASTDEGVAVVLQASALLSNDSDVDNTLALDTGVALTVAGGATTGTAAYDVNGDIVFTPEANFNGQAEITYTTNTGSTATVFVDVAPQNDGPVITTPAALTTAEDTATNIVGLSVSDADIGSDTLTVVLTASNGRINVNDGGGAATVTPDTHLVESVTVTGTLGDVNTAIGNIGFVPNEDYDGPASVTVTASDGQSGGVAVATVAIDVTTVNDAPEIIPSSPVTLSEGGTTIVAATNLFVDDADDNSLTITFNVTAAPANGFLALVTAPTTPITSFTGADIVTQQVVYVHDGSETTTDVFQVTATDPGGAVSSAAPIAIAIDAVNDAPVATSPGPLTAAEGAAAGVIGTVTSADTDPGDTALFELIGGNASGLFSIDGSSGAITLTGTGAGGAVDDADVGAYQLTVRVTDSAGEADEVAVSVTITDVNTAPTNTSGTTATMQEDGTYFGLLSATDADNDALTFTQIAPLPSNGTATVAPNGFIIYVPNADFNGTETINYEISDGNGGLTAGALTVTVNAVNDAPVVVAATQAATEDTAVTFDVLSNASDVDLDTMTVTGAAAGNGTVTIAGGDLTYTPNANYNGSDSIIYTVSDGNGGVTHGTIAVTVGAIDDAAVAGADFGELLEDVANGGVTADTLSVSGNLLANDSDVESGAATTVVSVNGTAVSGRTEIDATGAAIIDANAGLGALPSPLGTLVVFEDGTYHYEVDNALVQSLGVDDSVIVRFGYVNDQGATANLDVTIRGTNDGPVAAADAATMDENATASDTVSDPGGTSVLGAPGDADNTFTIDVLANDTDPDRTDPVGTFTLSNPTVTAVTDLIAGTGFTSTVTELNLVGGLLTVDGSNQLVVTPGTEFDELDAGDSVALTIEYTVTDVSGASDVGVVTLTVTGTNDAPVIVGTDVDLDEQTNLTDDVTALTNAGNLSFTDVDLDDNDHIVMSTVVASGVTTGFMADPATFLTLGAVTKALGDSTGTVGYSFSAADNAFDYLGEGEDLILTYTVEIDDQAGGVDTADIVVTVTGANDQPVLTVGVGDDVTGTLVEDGATPTLTDTGTITLTDVDLTDTHPTVTVGTPTITMTTGPLPTPSIPASATAAINAALTASVTDATTGDGLGEVTWNFALANSEAQFLAQGEVITAVYDITVTDDSGSPNATSNVIPVTVTITGANDDPTITSAAATPMLVELADTTGSTALLEADGTIDFADVDLSDDHTVTLTNTVISGVDSGFVGGAAAAAAFFTIDAPVEAVNAATGSAGWHFDAADRTFDYLADGESLTITYTVTVDDGQGGTAATQDVVVTVTGTNDSPTLGFAQDFSAGTDGIFDETDFATFGTITQSPSGTNGIVTPDGSDFALITESAGGTGPFTRFDGYRSDFVDGASTQVNVYLDTGWAAGEGFEYSVAANGSDGLHQRDFIFHVTQDTSTGNLIVGSSNNSNFAPREDLETIPHYDVPATGWYTLQHVFNDVAGVLSVDMNLIDSAGTIVWTNTLSSPLDDIAAEVGGTRYGWFTDVTVADGVAIDNVTLGNLTGAVGEIVDSGVGEGTATISSSGVMPFLDVDLSDTHTVVSAPDGVGYVGTFAVTVADDSTGDGEGVASWTFDVPDADVEHLGEGETLTQSYTVTLTDDSGVANDDSNTQTVTITITGTNDVPTIDLDVSDGTAAGNDYAGTFTENGLAVAIVDVGDMDIDDLDQTALITTATITLIDGHAGDALAVGAGLPATINAAVGPALAADGTIVVTLTSVAPGGAALLDFVAAIQEVTFNNTAADDPNTTDRTITVTVTDEQSATSATATSTISVELDLTQAVQIERAGDVVGTHDSIAGALAVAQASDTINIIAGAGTNPVIPTDNGGSFNVTVDELTIDGPADIAATPITGTFTLDASVTDGEITFTGGAAFDAVGNAGDNALVGNDGANTLVGGDGSDVLTGGAGADTFNYDVATEEGDLDVIHGDADTDQLNIIGTVADEEFHLTATATNIEIEIGAGAVAGDIANDLTVDGIDDIAITLGGGTDQVAITGDFTDTGLSTSTITVDGTTGSDGDTVDAGGLTSTHGVVFNAGDGDDTFISGAGNDSFEGGAGTDTVSYVDATAGVTVDLAAAADHATGGSGTDQLTNVENVTGSLFADIISGNAGDNIIVGGGGDDAISGGAGTDTAVLGGDSSTYAVTVDAMTGALTLDNGTDQVVVQADVENLTFGDVTIDLTDAVRVIDASGNFVATYDGATAIADAVGDVTTLDGHTLQILGQTTSFAESITVDKALSFVGVDVGNGLPVISGAGGTVITLDGTFAGADVSFSGINLNASGTAAIGINVVPGADIGTLSISGGEISGFTNRGIFASDNGDPIGTPAMDDLQIVGTNFSSNGTGAGNTAHIKLFGYSGDALFQGVQIDGETGVVGSAGRPDNAIEIIGFINSIASANPVGANAPDLGSIVFDGVTVAGQFHKNPIAIFNISEIDGLNIGGAGTTAGLDLSGAESFWGPLFNIDGTEDDVIDASAYDITFPATSAIHAEIQGEKDAQDVGTTTITGTDANDALMGKGGDDVLSGGLGDDRLYGSNKAGDDAETGNDRLTGGAGDDILVGGAETVANNATLYEGDVAIFTDAVSAADITALATDVTIDSTTYTGQRGWTVDASGGTTDEGTDTLVNVEVIEHGGAGRILLVGNGGFDTIQAAIDEAADGDTIMLAPGTYAEDLTISIGITILGPNNGLAGNDAGRTAEAIIEGEMVINSAMPVTIDGIEVLNSAATSGNFRGITIASDVGHEIENSVFLSQVTGGSSGDYAVFSNVLSGGAFSIVNNFFTTDIASPGAFSTAAWDRGVWSNGGGVGVNITGNEFNSTRTGVNLESYTDGNSDVSGNTFTLAGSGISVGVGSDPVITAVANNTFDDVGTDFNLRNLTGDIDFDLTATGNVSTAGQPTVVLGGSGNDDLGGSAGVDILVGDNNPGAAATDDDNTFTGRGGDDQIVGAGENGVDTSIYTATLTTAEITVVADTGIAGGAPPVPGWQVATGGAEGTDLLTDVEVVHHADGTVLLVGSGGFDSIQAAVSAASDGDTILIAPGAYDESVTVDKALSFVGADDGLGGTVSVTSTAGTAFTLSGDLSTGADAVSFDNITFENAIGSGIEAGTGVTLGTLTVTNATFTENFTNGVRVSNGETIGTVNITDSTFVGNGDPANTSSGDGDILLFNFEGVALLQDLQLTGTAAGTGPGENGIQIRSDGAGGTAGPIGSVSINNVTIDGVYEKQPIAISNFTDIDGLVMNTVTVNADSTGFNTAINLDTIGGSFDLNNMDTGLGAAFINVTAPNLVANGDVIALQGDGAANPLIRGAGDGDFIRGFGGDDNLVGEGGDDILVGDSGDGLGSGADTLTGGAGDDLLHGDGGTDVAVYTGAITVANLTAGTVTGLGGAMVPGWTVVATGSAEGTDTLVGVERIQHSGGADILLVGSGGFATIQDAVTAAASGDTILVAGAGASYAGAIIDKAITLISTDGTAVIADTLSVVAGGDMTTIGMSGQGFTITGNDGVIVNGATGVTVQNNTIDGGALQNAGVILQGNVGTTQVINNTISNYTAGVFAIGAMGASTISGNTLSTGNGTAVWLDAATTGVTVTQSIASVQTMTPGAEIVDVNEGGNTVNLGADVHVVTDTLNGTLTDPNSTAGTNGTGYFDSFADAATNTGDNGAIALNGDGTTNFGTANVAAAGVSVSGDAGESAAINMTGAGAQTLTLSGAADIDVEGNAQANTVIGNDGDNDINTYGGVDTVTDGGGIDVIDLGGDDDFAFLSADSADDTLIGGSGFDTINLSNATGNTSAVLDASGTSTVSGGGLGSNTISAFESVIGGAFVDNIGGSAVANTLDGGDGADILVGNDGADIIRGGANDMADDTLSGNVGVGLIQDNDRDDFVFSGLFGNDTVKDFEDGTDMLQLIGSVFGTEVTIADAGADTLITVTGGNTGTILLEDFDHTLIDSNDFDFS